MAAHRVKPVCRQSRDWSDIRLFNPAPATCSIMPDRTAKLEALMAQYQATLDGGAFAQLVDALATPALAAARRIVGEHMSAEDAVQETFLRVVRNRESYDSARPFTGWFFTILRNVCLDMLRQRQAQATTLEQALPPYDRHQTSDARGPERTLEMMELLARLPVDDRVILELKIMEGLPLADIAAILGLSEEAAKKRAQRGLQRLRADYEQAVRPRVSVTNVIREIVPQPAVGK